MNLSNRIESEFSSSVKVTTSKNHFVSLPQVALGAAVFITALLAIELTRQSGRIASIWIANAIVVAILLKKPVSEWRWWLFAGLIGNIAADMVSGDAPLQAFLLSLCNTVEILIVCSIAHIKQEEDLGILAGFDAMAKYLLLGVVVGTAISAILANLALYMLNGTPFGSILSVWFRADILGLLIIVPLLAGVTNSEIKAAFSRKKRWESLALIILIPLLTFFAFTKTPSHFSVLFVLITLTATLRLGFAGGVIATFLLTTSGLISIVFFGGAIARDLTFREEIELLQVYAFVSAFVALPVAILLRVVKKNERRYHDLFDNAGDAIVIHEIDPPVLREINPAAMKQFGYSRDEMLKMRVEQLDSPEEAKHAHDRVAKLFNKGYHRFETVHIRKDGTLIPTEVNSRLINWDGHPLMMSICRDITERKQSEMIVQEQHARLSSILESTQNPICSVDLQYRYTGFNLGYAAIMKEIHNSDIELGKSLLDYLKDDAERALAKATLDRAFEGEHFILEDQWGQTSTWLEVSHNPIRDEKGAVIGVAIFAQDVTERKLANEELASKIEELQHAAEHIKTLRGIVPICAKCKKIRDDKGYWNMVEVYIRDHSEAEFSHSICPDCMRELYPDYIP